MHRFHALAVLALLLGCPAGEDCPDLDSIDLATRFDYGDACFADYERPDSLNIQAVSAADAGVSHNMGRNCQECHQENGPGLGLFSAAGTIYMADGNVAPAGTLVGLYEDRERQILVDELEVDVNGNVYTTADLGLDTAKLFVTIWSEDGTLRNDMGSAKYNLSCNFCHDASFRADLNPATDLADPEE